MLLFSQQLVPANMLLLFTLYWFVPVSLWAAVHLVGSHAQHNVYKPNLWPAWWAMHTYSTIKWLQGLALFNSSGVALWDKVKVYWFIICNWLHRCTYTSLSIITLKRHCERFTYSQTAHCWVPSLDFQGCIWEELCRKLVFCSNQHLLGYTDISDLLSIHTSINHTFRPHNCVWLYKCM